MDKHSCTIIIDTNQFHSDFMLSEVRWRNLLEYLDKTGACLQMPLVIWEEIAKNYRKTLDGHLKKSTAAIEKVNHLTNFDAPHFHYRGQSNNINFGGIPFSLHEMSSRYMSFLKDKLRLETKDFLPWDDSWMSNIVTRAIEHTKPFGDESDKGFKDTLIWKTILALGNKPGFQESPIVFISSNNRDFGNGSQAGKLHSTLAKEASDAGLTVHYFENLDKFFEQWASEALNMNYALIRKSIPDNLVISELRQYVRKYLPVTEAVEQNTFVSGMNFKVSSETSGEKTIQLSISGYITNSLIPTKYLDYSAEASFESPSQRLTIESFSIDVDHLRSPSIATSIYIT